MLCSLLLERFFFFFFEMGMDVWGVQTSKRLTASAQTARPIYDQRLLRQCVKRFDAHLQLLVHSLHIFNARCEAVVVGHHML